jgi:single-strand DNA-binding protein
MLGGGSGSPSMQNDKIQTGSKNIEDIPQSSNDLDDDIPF